MQDGLGREIDYLRISVTDKCNLRCRYCMPPQGITSLAHEEILTLEEIFRLVGIMEQLGIRKVRLTGGEPMVRKNLPWLVEKIHGLYGIREIAMTTNGTLFAPQAKVYREAGLTAVNISLDTLDPERFRCITGCDRADRAAGVDSVLRAIDAALEQQLKVKINCVPCVEMNGEDMEGIAALAEDRPVDVRFIELMPIGLGSSLPRRTQAQVMEILEGAFGPALPCERAEGAGPGQYVTFRDFQGKVGFISAMTHQFCGDCNRVRLTATGFLKTCLQYEAGVDLKALLDSGASDEALRSAMASAIARKPAAHHFTEGREALDERRNMNQIGG